ncbi:MAG: hypothetical protein ACI8RD_009335 [Bacillariaceae sp.]|jgi:hypothetical protein
MGAIRLEAVLVIALIIVSSCDGLSQSNRRNFLKISSVFVVSPSPCFAALPPISRDVDVGGGFDLLSGKKLSEKDVIYPKSMEGLWHCDRFVTGIEGDTFQATEAFRCLSGNKSNQPQQGNTESFGTRYIFSPAFGDSSVVVDRGFEVASRMNTNTNPLRWNVENPDVLEFDNKVKLVVVKRSVEPPTDKGFGFDELIRVEDGITTRAIQVKRRYRRSFDDQGNRVVEGLEIMKTFRVLDGIAGTEYPTSTIKSQIRLVRPTSSDRNANATS